jgi:hypothetical protein
LENMSGLMSLFEKIEGAKVLILFQDQLRYTPGEVYPFVEDTSDTSSYLKELARAANERNVRIYPVHATGLDTSQNDSADDAMTFLASETGGKVVEHTNRLGLVFDEVAEDAACSYRAGFHFRPLYSGASQRIEVRVSGPARGYRVRHRRSVDDPTRESMEANLLSAAMLAPASAVGLPVRVRAVPFLSDASMSRVRIEVSVPISSLLGLPTAGSPVGTQRFLVQVGGRIVSQLGGSAESPPSGERSAWADVDTGREALAFSGQAEFTIPPPSPARAAGERTLVRVVEVGAPAGAYRVVGVVEDRLAGTIGAGLRDFRAGAEPAALGPVGLLVESPRSVIVHGGSEEIARSDAGVRAEKKAVLVEPALPPKAVLAPDETVERGRDAEIYYSVCGLPPGGGTLERRVECVDGGDPISLPPKPAPALGAGEACSLIVEKIAAAALSGEECAITIALSAPGRATESRTLTIHLRSAGE